MGWTWLGGLVIGVCCFGMWVHPVAADEFGVEDRLYVGGAMTSPYGGIGRYENLLERSEALDDAAWTKTGGVTASANAVAGPDGTTSAETLTDDVTAGGTVTQTEAVTLSADTSYTFSIWLKAGTGTTAKLKLEGNATGEVATETAALTLTSTWQRFSVTDTITNNTAGGETITATLNHTGGASTTLHAWGAQLEQASSPGVYAKTGASSIAAGRGLVSAVGGVVFPDGTAQTTAVQTTSAFLPDTGGSLTTGLVSYWKLDEATGTQKRDAVSVNDGTATNGPTIVAGKIGNALSFNGTTQYVSFSSTLSTVVGDWTLAAWVNPANLTTTDGGAVSIGNFGIAGGGAGILLNLTACGSGSFGITYAGPGWTVCSSSGLFQANQWSYVVITKSAGPINTTTKLYLNGALVTATADGSGTPSVDNRPPFIGVLKNYGNGALSNYFNGLIDEVGIWSKALTATEITDLYNSGSGNAYRTSTAIGGWTDDGTVVRLSTGSDQVGIGTTSPAATAALDITSTTKGLLAPRMTTTQRDAITTPAAGLLLYNTTTNAYNVYNGTSWGAVGGGTSVADPTGTLGLTAVAGTASTAMRSDAAPALSQAITPTWTGAHTFTATSASPILIKPSAAPTVNTKLLDMQATGAGTTNFSVDAEGDVLANSLTLTVALPDTQLATISTAGKVADSALSATVTKLGATIETGEITDLTIATADLAADAVTDAKVVDTLTASNYLPLVGGTLTGNLVIPNAGTIGQAAGPLLTFDDTANELEISGGNVGIGTTTPQTKLEVAGDFASPYGGIGRYENLLLRSEEFDNASWVKTNVAAITADGISAPNGTASAEALSPATAATTTVKQTSTTAAAASTAYTFSVWGKVSTGTKSVILTVGDDGATVTTNTATASLTTSWQRFAVTYTAVTTPDGNVFAQVGDATWTADTVHLWGAQLEKASSPGVYVRTTTAAISASRGAVSDGTPIGSGAVKTYQAVGSTSGPTTTSATWVDLPEMSVTFTPQSASNPLLILFSGTFQHSGSAGATAHVGIYIDDVFEANTQRSGHPDASRLTEVTTQKVVTLSAASHTVKIKWATDAATLTAVGTNRILSVVELPVSSGTGGGGVSSSSTNTFTAPTASPILIKPASAPVANTKLLDMQATGAGTTNFSVDAEGDVTANSLSLTVALPDTQLATISTAGKVADTALSATVTKLGATIESSEITDLTIATADLAADAVTSAKILDGTVATADVADSAVTSVKITDGTIATADVADGAITWAKLNGTTNLTLDAAAADLARTLTITNAAADTATAGTPDLKLIVKGGAGQGATTEVLDIQKSDATSLFAVEAGGNVGIGTTSPGQKLDVVGSGTGTLDVARLQNTVAAANNSGSQLLLAANRTTSGLTNVAGLTGLITDITDTAYKGALVFATANNAAPAERMRIDNAGNVGIGATSPSQKTDIWGSAVVADDNTLLGSGTTTINTNTTWTSDQTFTNLTITNSATVTVDSINKTGGAGQIVVTVNGNLTIDAGATLSTNGRGNGAGAGTGAGQGAPGQGAYGGAGGGGHGGSGGNGTGAASGYPTSLGGSSYGSATQPTGLGSGGGSWGGSPGGAGGGAVKLTVNGTLTLNGSIAADGTGGSAEWAGGGSGGSLWIKANNTFAGAGSITANGGAGSGNGGGGGGGRIAISYATKTYTGSFTATAGIRATAGTISEATIAAGPTAGPSTLLRLTDTTTATTGVGGGLVFSGYYDAVPNRAAFAGLKGIKENATSGDYAGALAFYTRANGSAQAEQMRISSSGTLAIGTTSPAATALLDLTSTTKGLLAPRMTTTQRDAITSPAAGLLLYNTTTNAYNVYNGTAWVAVGSESGNVLTTSTNTFTATTASPILIKPSSAPTANTKLLDMQATGAGTTNFSVDAEGDVTANSLTLTVALPDTQLATISTAGKVVDSALSSNVPLKAAANTFTATTASPLLIKPSAAPTANTKLLDMQATGAGTTNFSIDAEGDVLANSLSLTVALPDTQLAPISTAGKVSGAALTSLASVPSAAGVIPAANTPLGAAIDSSEVTDGTLVAADLATSAVTKPKLSELAPTAQATPDLTVAIAAGKVFVSGNTLVDAVATTANFASGGNCAYAPVAASKFLKALIALTSSNTLACTFGTEQLTAGAAESESLSYPTDRLPLAEVVLKTTGTTAGALANIEAAAGTNSYLYRDVRPFLNLSSSGVTSVAKSGSTALAGAVTFSSSGAIILTQSGQDIAISAPTGGGGDVLTTGTNTLTATTASPIKIKPSSAPTANTKLLDMQATGAGTTNFSVDAEGDVIANSLDLTTPLPDAEVADTITASNYLPLAGGTLTGNIVIPNAGTIGQAAGPLLTFDDTANELEITGANVGIGTASPSTKLHVVGKDDTAEVVAFMPGTDTAAAGTPDMKVGIGTTSPAFSLDVGARTDALRMPVGTTAQRPTPANGAFRFNSGLGTYELYANGFWFRQDPMLMSDSAKTKVTFTYTGADQTWVVPTGVNYIFVKLWGAGGAGGTPGGWSYGAPGGAGGHTRGIIPVTPGETLTIKVGQQGSANQAAGYGYGGGASGTNNNVDNRYGGGGGGMSAVFRGATPLLIAGGGGGGGSSRYWVGNSGGAGGGLNGQHGESPYDGKYVYGGGGGSQTAGGTATGGLSGIQYQGGQSGTNSYGGGGGGGYYGGAGGGYSESNTMGGGGGGSGYIGPTVLFGITLTGTFQIPPMVSDPDFIQTGDSYTLHAHGGSMSNHGSNGFVVLYQE